jgi:hypothetical protein
MLDSLVRVSRRVDGYHLASIPSTHLADYRQCPRTYPRAALLKQGYYVADQQAPRLAPRTSSEIFSLGPPRGMATSSIKHPRQGKPCPNYLPTSFLPQGKPMLTRLPTGSNPRPTPQRTTNRTKKEPASSPRRRRKGESSQAQILVTIPSFLTISSTF